MRASQTGYSPPEPDRKNPSVAESDSTEKKSGSRSQQDAVHRNRLALLDEAFWVGHGRRTSMFFRFSKRLIDIVVSTLALVFLSPILLAVAIAIAVESPGPIIFRQLRVGKYNIPFTMYKFRSMRLDAESLRDKLLAINEMDGPVFKIRRDPRVTRVGNFIRRWSLDELPQLFNVFRGEMTLVGPRPLPVTEVAEMSENQMRRHSVKPGLTCIWQISGRNDISFDEWIQLDLIYVDNQSAMLDIEIFLRTFGAVFKRKGSS